MIAIVKNLSDSSHSQLLGSRSLGCAGGGLSLNDSGLTLCLEIGLGLGLGSLLGGAGSSLDVDGNARLLGSALALLGSGRLGLALGASSLLSLVALGAISLTLAALLSGLGAVLVASSLDNLDETAENELNAADGVIVAGDHVVDRLRVGVRIDDGDDGDAETDSLLDGVGLADDVHDDECAGLLGHIGDTGEVLLKLIELATEHGSLLLVLGELAAVGLRSGLELTHALDGGADGLGVRERTAEPTLGDVELADGSGGLLDELGNLLLRGNKKDVLASENSVAEELGRLVEKRDALGEIDDVDTVALVEDVVLHLRIPALRLVTEVETSVKHILKANSREGRYRHFHLFVPFNL